MKTGISNGWPQISCSTIKYNGAAGVFSQYSNCEAIFTSALLAKKIVASYETFTAAAFVIMPVNGSISPFTI